MDSTIRRTEPETLAELHQWNREYPQHAHRWRPADEELERMTEAARMLCFRMTGRDLEITEAAFDPPEPLPVDVRRRLLATLLADMELREAIRRLLR